MATRKEVTARINSVKNIRKITRAMEMVAAARLRRAEQRIDNMRPYAQAIRKLTREVAQNGEAMAKRVPLMETRDVSTVGIVLVTGDRGLAGAFNTQIIREGVRLKREYKREDSAETEYRVVGRRGSSTMSFRGENVVESYMGFTERPSFSDARDISRDLTAAFRDGEVDKVDLVYNRYVSPLTQYVRRQTLLPMSAAEVFGEGIPEEEGYSDEELAEAHQRSEMIHEPRRGDTFANADRGVRGPFGLSRSPRVVRVGAGRADDGDAFCIRERGGDDRRPDPGDEPGAPVGDHPGDS